MKKIFLLVALIIYSIGNSKTTCPAPSQLTATSVTGNSVAISWTENGNAQQWEIYATPCGTPVPTAITSGVITSTINPFYLTGLNADTCYSIYVRAVCSQTDFSAWSGALNITTLINPPNCGGSFVDNGGITGNYSNNLDLTTTICPPIPGNLISITFTSFDIEDGNDFLYVYDGNSIVSPLIGVYTGTTIPTVITATNTTGCLTFRFRSNGSITNPGWTSDITCAPQPCLVPTNLSLSNITNTSVILSWANSSFYGSEVLVLPYGSPTPTNTTAGILVNGTSIYLNNLTLNDCYSFYVKNGCSGIWSTPISYCMLSCANNAQCSESLDLIAFLDANNNGVKDVGENNFMHGNFVYEINNSGAPINGYSNSGTFLIFDSNSNNSYNLNFVVNQNLISYYSSSGAYTNINIPTGSGTNTYYFPITQLQPYNDLEIFIIPNFNPRPGFSYGNTILYRNNGIQSVPSGTITFTKSPLVTISNISVSGTTSTPTGFNYTFNNLNPSEIRYLYVDMQVPTIPTVNLGDLLTNSVTIEPLNDTFPLNNAATLSQIVVGSYDPNDKCESHGGKIALNEFSSNDYLTYTIQFENTGTANAEFIRVEDELNPLLNTNSVEMINSSHDYNLKRIGNKLIWYFYDINLPPSTSANPLLGHGFVQFKIKPNSGYSVGTIIPNKADIYFDYNPPIITNTFETEFVQSLKVDTFENNDFALYPNPTNTSIIVSLNDKNNLIQQLQIIDVLGKSIKEVKTNASKEIKVDVSDLSKGVYLVEILSEKNIKTTKKLVIN